MKNAHLPTSRSLPIALLRARERVMGPIRTMLADVDVTEQQWRVLRVLHEGGAMEPTAISEMACLLLPSLTRILQKLEEKKLIVRNPHPSDKRRQVIVITQTGRDLIDSNQSAAQELAEDLRVRMGPDRYALLLDLLAELENIEETPREQVLAK